MLRSPDTYPTSSTAKRTEWVVRGETNDSNNLLPSEPEQDTAVKPDSQPIKTYNSTQPRASKQKRETLHKKDDYLPLDFSMRIQQKVDQLFKDYKGFDDVVQLLVRDSFAHTIHTLKPYKTLSQLRKDMIEDITKNSLYKTKKTATNNKQKTQAIKVINAAIDSLR